MTMLQVYFTEGTRRPISCTLPDKPAAIRWIRDYWTREDGTLYCAVTIQPATNIDAALARIYAEPKDI